MIGRRCFWLISKQQNPEVEEEPKEEEIAPLVEHTPADCDKFIHNLMDFALLNNVAALLNWASDGQQIMDNLKLEIANKANQSAITTFFK